MNVLVIQNNAQTPAALVGDHLVAAGATLAPVLPLAPNPPRRWSNGSRNCRTRASSRPTWN